ncbi:MAG: DNA repair protein RadA, partial [Duncaniella sp.]|nr:DNA repair protein RadA [Duncaniella sp.]
MAKTKTSAWFCTACGNETPKWEGRCPACGEWNTIVEEKIPAARGGKQSGVRNGKAAPQSRPTPVSSIEATEESRIKMPSVELNRVLGGGLVEGSMVLIG